MQNKQNLEGYEKKHKQLDLVNTRGTRYGILFRLEIISATFISLNYIFLQSF